MGRGGKLCHVHAPAAHKTCKHCVLQICTKGKGRGGQEMRQGRWEGNGERMRVHYVPRPARSVNIVHCTCVLIKN